MIRLPFSADDKRLVGVHHHGWIDSRVAPGARIDVSDTSTGRTISQLLPHADDITLRGYTEAQLRLLHVSQDGNRVVARSHHSVYDWKSLMGQITRFEGTFGQEDATYQEVSSTDTDGASPMDLKSIVGRFLRECGSNLE